MTDGLTPPRPVNSTTSDQYSDDALTRLQRFDTPLHAVLASLKMSLDPNLSEAERDHARLVTTQRANALEGSVSDLQYCITLIRAASGAVAASTSAHDTDEAFLADARRDSSVVDAETVAADAALIRRSWRSVR